MGRYKEGRGKRSLQVKSNVIKVTTVLLAVLFLHHVCAASLAWALHRVCKCPQGERTQGWKRCRLDSNHRGTISEV
jgi:hypothetical protein